MEIIVADQIIMGLILNAGDAKQHIYQALKLAKEGNFAESKIEIELADSALLGQISQHSLFILRII